MPDEAERLAGNRDAWMQVVTELPESALFTAAEDLEREIESQLHREKARVALAALGKDRPPKKLRIILQSRHFHQAAAPAGQAAAGEDCCCCCIALLQATAALAAVAPGLHLAA